MQPSRDLSKLEIAEQVDEHCDRFEAAWNAGQRPQIEEYVAAAAAGTREPLLRALIAVEVELMQQSGSAVMAETYLERFPNSRETIEELFFRSSPPPADEQTVSLRASDIGTSHGPAAAVASTEPPQQVGRFTILQELGHGAFGVVYRAFDPQLQREVALKTPHAGVLRSPADRERFLREARSAATLDHPHVCTVYEVGEIDDQPYIVMALVEGQSLAERLKAGSPLTEQQALVIVRQIALALDEAHRKGVVHRDLKPANIMLNSRGEPVVMDFGLARCDLPGDTQITSSGTILGTPAYMSPEQARGEAKNIGPTSDIYSLGVLLYELLCGHRPFEGTFGEVIGQILHVEPVPPSRHNPEISHACEAICLQAMSKQPGERYSSMRELAYIVEACLVLQDAPPRSLSRRQWLVAASLGGLAALLAAIVFFARTPSALVTITVAGVNLDDPSLNFRLDDKPVRPATLAAPIELKVGEHELLVQRGPARVKHLLLNVRGGRNPGIDYHEINVPTPPPPPPPPPVIPPVDPASAAESAQSKAERRAAEHLARLGPLRITVHGRAQRVERGGKVPPGEIQLLDVLVELNEEVTDADLAPLSDTKSLHELKLINCRRITDAGLAHLAGQASLRWLVVQNARITDRGIAQLDRLARIEGIAFSGAAITDEGLKHFSSHPKLLMLDVGRTQITDAGLEHLKPLKQLVDLSLYENPAITDAGLAHLGELTNLEVLQVQGSRITDAGVEQLRPLQWLKHLDIGQSAVTDASLPTLAEFTRLERLFLQRSRVTGAGLDHLQRLPHLEKLSLQGSPLTSAAVAPLSQLTSLQYLDLYHTSLTAADLQTLRAALPKCRIEPAAASPP